MSDVFLVPAHAGYPGKRIVVVVVVVICSFILTNYKIVYLNIHKPSLTDHTCQQHHFESL